MTSPNADAIVRSISTAEKPRQAGIRTVAMDTVERKDIHWLMPPYLALAKLAVIAGLPGLGKSMLTMNLAAHVSTGRRWADGSPCPEGSVVLISGEDDPGDTLLPRLEAAGANLSRVHYVEAVAEVNGERSFTLADVVYLEELVKKLGDCRLIIVDPVSAYMGSIDSHKNADVRGLLAPLAQMAADYGVAVIAVTHLNKGGAGGDAIGRVMGSLALVAAARAAYAVIRDKDDETRRLMLPLKNNLGPDAGGLAYRILSDRDAPYIVFDAEKVTGLTVDDAMRPDDPYSDERSAVDEAEEFLQNMLVDGSRKMKEVQAEANAAGLSWASVRRAKTRLRIVATKHGGEGGKSYWAWALPAPKAPTPYTHAHLEHIEHLPWAPTPVEAIQGAHREHVPEHLAAQDDEEVVDI